MPKEDYYWIIVLFTTLYNVTYVENLPMWLMIDEIQKYLGWKDCR